MGEEGFEPWNSIGNTRKCQLRYKALGYSSIMHVTLVFKTQAYILGENKIVDNETDIWQKSNSLISWNQHDDTRPSWYKQ